MNSYELRALQSPLKEKYKVIPAAVVFTLRAESRMSEGIAGRIELTFALDTDADMTSTEKLIKLTERYCIVLQTLQNSADILIYKKHCP